MASESNASSVSTGPKTKQERIRDNQRRSRARRQEYLADLERRLKECHATCRDAELQRTALADLQVENARLRDLLKFAGVSSDMVEGYGRQTMSMPPNHIVAAQHRQLRPKYQPSISTDHPTHIVTAPGGTTPGLRHPASSPALQLCGPASSIPTPSPDMYGRHHSVPFVPTPAPETMSMSSATDISPLSPYDWLQSSDGKQCLENSFCCDTFAIPPSGPLLPDTGDTVPCTVAKMMVDQYHPSSLEMEEIKARLSTGFSLPRAQETNCRVNSSLLYHVLQDMNTRDIHG
jgi:hypothetical protein